MRQQCGLEYGICKGGGQQYDAVRGYRDRWEVVLAHPGRGDRDERQPEQKVLVGPQRHARDPGNRREHVVVVVPVDADEDETEHVGQQHW